MHISALPSGRVVLVNTLLFLLHSS